MYIRFTCTVFHSIRNRNAIFLGLQNSRFNFNLDAVGRYLRRYLIANLRWGGGVLLIKLKKEPFSVIFLKDTGNVFWIS